MKASELQPVVWFKLPAQRKYRRLEIPAQGRDPLNGDTIPAFDRGKLLLIHDGYKQTVLPPDAAPKYIGADPAHLPHLPRSRSGYGRRLLAVHRSHRLALPLGRPQPLQPLPPRSPIKHSPLNIHH